MVNYLMKLWILRVRTSVDDSHQTDKDEDELYDVCVCHRIETAQQCVGDGHGSRDPHTERKRQVKHHAHDPPLSDTRIHYYRIEQFCIIFAHSKLYLIFTWKVLRAVQLLPQAVIRYFIYSYFKGWIVVYLNQLV